MKLGFYGTIAKFPVEQITLLEKIITKNMSRLLFENTNEIIFVFGMNICKTYFCFI